MVMISASYCVIQHYQQYQMVIIAMWYVFTIAIYSLGARIVTVASNIIRPRL